MSTTSQPSTAAPGSGDTPPQRYTAALAAELELAWQDRWEADGTFQAPNPTGRWPRPGRRTPGARRSSSWTCSRTRRGRGCTSGIRWATSPPTSCGALPADARRQRPAHPRLRRVRPARRAVRRPDGPAPAGDDRGQHDEHAPPAAPSRPGPRPAPLVLHDRRRLLPLDAVDLPAGVRAPGTTRTPCAPTAARRRPPGRRAARGLRSRPPRPRTGGLGRAGRRRAPPAGRRAAAGLRLRDPGQLVPGPGHGAGERGGHRRRALRARQLPGLQAQPAPVDACGSPPTPTAWSTTSTASTGPRP